ncbi:hypothetical protein E3O37_25265 [Burkholderia pseudomallei]|nr:hypothetical protein E3O37_25265 [Burkholderia pseudomallei]
MNEARAARAQGAPGSRRCGPDGRSVTRPVLAIVVAASIVSPAIAIAPVAVAAAIVAPIVWRRMRALPFVALPVAVAVPIAIAVSADANVHADGGLRRIHRTPREHRARQERRNDHSFHCRPPP